MMRFADRVEAGKFVAEKLAVRGYRGADAVILALPRGGIPVGFEVANRLGLPLDVLVVRKLGFPGHEEFAMGAIASGGTIFLDTEVIQRAALPKQAIDSVVAREEQELQRRDRAYRDGRPRIPVQGKTVILVDDGLATGSTMRAAIKALRKESPRSIVVAVPVGAEETCLMLKAEADEVICATTPDPFQAVGLWYKDFTQTTDEEVRDYLRRAHESQPISTNPAPPTGKDTGKISSLG